MIHKQSVYKTVLMLHIPVIVLLFCCATLIGCPETEQMVDDVITPSSEDKPPPSPSAEDTPPPPPSAEDTPPPPSAEDTPPPPADTPPPPSAGG